MDLSDIINIIVMQLEKLGDLCSAEDKKKLKELLAKVFMEDKPLLEAMAPPKEDLEMMYSFAVEYYKAGRYTDANNGFTYLQMQVPNDPRFSFGLAASYHKLKDYKLAIENYLTTARIDPQNPAPWAHAADCYIQMERPDLAVIMFAKAIEISGNNPAYAGLKKEAVLIKDTLDKQMAAAPAEQKIGEAR